MSDIAFSSILLVEDDDVSRQLLAHALERRGYEVIECADGHEALQIIETSGPVLLVVDYEMPELTGAQVCEMIRKHENQAIATLPIILLTAHTGEEHEVESLASGADDFITKPINVTILKARIDTQIRLHEMRMQLQQQNSELESWRQAHELDLQAASLTQQAILPVRPPPLDGWDVAAHYQPVIQIGGDIFDWLRLPDGGWLFWIADATGHGVSAALHTALIKLLFRHAAAESSEPCKILIAVNTEYYSVFKGKSFMTAACVAVRSGDGRIQFAGAGHPPLFIIRAGASAETLPSLSPPLGIVAALHCEEAGAAVAPGDTVLLYTDGLYSGANAEGERLTPDDLRHYFPATSISAADFLDRTVAAVSESADGLLPDDLAAIALRRH
jgi:sigma-B regulation protein RsbU (phosphoserine phosphatase)